LNPEPRSKKVVNRVILPLDPRDDGMAADSVFSPPATGNISIIGEVFRKLIHLGAIAIPVGYYFLGIKLVVAVLALALLISLSLDYIRIFGQMKSRKFVYKYLGVMIRPKEKKELVGATYIICGSILTILFFDKPVAMAAISFIVVGDTAGAIIGRLWGRVRFRSKSLEGSISFFIACCLVSIVIPGIPFWIKVMGALAATVVEAITLHIDDNLIVPITSAALMQVVVNQMVILAYFS
jgi:acyl phosphate:glycerol-3-phosphate acyltransferase